MPRYNLRSSAAAQNSPNVPANNNDNDLNATIIDVAESMPPSIENDQLSEIMAGLNDLTRAVLDSRKEIDILKNQIQQQRSMEQQHEVRFGAQSELNFPQQGPVRTEAHSEQNLQQQQSYRSENSMGQNMQTYFSSHNLRKIYDLPVYSGKPEEWPLFYANFKDSTNEFNYNHRHNLMRLQKCLTGDAREAVASLLIYPNDVPKVIEELEFRFGRPDLLVRSQLQIVQKFPPISAKRLEQIITFATKVRNVVAFLNSANCSHHLLNSTLLEELVSKLPVD